MITYFVKPSGNFNRMIKFDDETKECDAIEYDWTDINWIFVVPEDGALNVSEKGTKKVKDVKKGQIVIQFYDREYSSTDCIVIDNPEWIKRIEEKTVWENDKNCSCDECTNKDMSEAYTSNEI